MKERNYAIGVFDSGLGGLTVVRSIQRELPAEDIHYFGDIARLPYGIKSTKQIIQFSIQNTEFLLKTKIKALVVACNSSASASLQALRKNFSLPIVDVITPAAQLAVDVSTAHQVAVIGTTATIESHAYKKEINSLDPKIHVIEKACPLLVPLVEAGWLEHPITLSVIREYLNSFLRPKTDTLILGCTHYPLLKKAIQRVAGGHVALIDSAPSTSKRLREVLERRELLTERSGKKGKLKVYVSDLPRNFLGIGERFLGQKIRNIEVVAI
jgi:glutamate racemase